MADVVVVGQRDLDRTAHEALGRLNATLTGSPDVRLLSVRLAARPMPADGLPVVGPLPGIDGGYVAVMHSGVTLAPVVGRLVAAEVVHGARAENWTASDRTGSLRASVEPEP